MFASWSLSLIFSPVENMGPQRPMKLINFFRLMIRAIWVTKSHYKGYKIGFSVKKRNRYKNHGFFRKIIINTEVPQKI